MIRKNEMNRELVNLMYQKDYDQVMLAKEMGFETASPLSMRLSGKIEWKLQECYQILRILGEPIERLQSLFPPKEDKPCSQKSHL